MKLNCAAHIICWLLCLPALVAGSVSPGPLVITHGGTYQGTWTSDDADVPVASVKTSEPVIFDHCTFTGRGNLIESRFDHSDITIRNCTAVGENPNKPGKCAGRFLDDESFDRVRVEHCELNHTAGIYLRDCIGDAKQNDANTIAIIANHAFNIDGRISNGHDGYLNFNLRTNIQTGEKESGFHEVQFVQLDGVHSTPGIEIAWNQVFNEPGQSRVEDNVNLYNSSGMPGSPIMVHDNCIHGAYNLDPTAIDKTDEKYHYDWSYTGGGIMLGDGEAKLASDRPAYIAAMDNVVIGTTNYGIAISAGHDISFQHNTIISSGLLPNGQPIAAQNVGAYIWNVYKSNRTNPSTFTANGGRDNLIGWMKGKDRNDSWTPDAAFWIGNTAIKAPITHQTEEDVEQKWLASAKQKNIRFGLEPPAGK
jgi:hypothetical protein